MSLNNAIRVYRKEFAPRGQAELDYFQGLPTLAAAVEAAAMAVGPDGKMLNHQHRVGRRVLAKAKVALLARLKQIKACESFDELHDLIDSVTGSIERVGPLTVYDTATRIGAWLGLSPEVVYLHAGTKKGAAALGLNVREGIIRPNDLPPALRRMPMDEVESFLCIFKDRLGRKSPDQHDGGFGTGCAQKGRNGRGVKRRFGCGRSFRREGPRR